MTKVYISLGTNLGNRKLNLKIALATIEKKCGKVLQKSSIYTTPPWGYSSFNTFLNMVALVQTTLPARKFLDSLQQIEKCMGRASKKGDTYEDRIIDIDILFYENEVIATPLLTVPHPAMHKRNFVLAPLAEIAPDYVHPTLHQTVTQLLKNSTDDSTVAKLP